MRLYKERLAVDIDFSYNGQSLPIEVSDPHKMNTGEVIGRIRDFLARSNEHVDRLGLEDLLPKMVRGIAGCEGGCPANAQALVRAGFKEYDLEYIEGGILTARLELGVGRAVEIKMFPDF